MEKLNIKEITDFTKGNLLQNENDETILSVIIDDRNVENNCLFVPIIGEVHDGHKFMDKAYDKGCRNFLIDKNHEFNKPDINLIEVEDTTVALGDIAKNYRNKFAIPFIGITGSVGKTSTKDIIASVLNQKYKTFYLLHKSLICNFQHPNL